MKVVPPPAGEAPDDLAALAVEVAERAGALLLARRRDPAGRRALLAGAEAKSTPTDLVTEVDRASEQLIVSSLLAARPNDGILAEEGSKRPGSSGIVWVVDPLDGTINYLYGLAPFAVSIAAERDGALLAAAVVDPLAGETFSASAGGGAHLDGRRLVLEPGRPLDRALVGTGFSYDAGRRRHQAALLPAVLPAVRDLRRGGSAALDLCAVAAGRLDAHYEAGLAPWDLAAGRLVCTEAGASVRLLTGLVPGSRTVVAAAPGLGAELEALLRRAARAARPAARRARGAE